MTSGPLRRPTMFVRLRSEPHETVERPASEAKPMLHTSEESWDRFALNPVVNGQQMRTLIDPEEHIEKVTHSVDVGSWNHSMDRMWDDKEEEARAPQAHSSHGSGVYDWMARGDRQRSPIELRLRPGTEGYGQGEGHHRVAAAAALQRESGEPRLVKFKGTEAHYLGITGGTQHSDYEPTYEPTPVPSSQRTTERKPTPSNAQRLEPRTSRRGSFTWSPPAAPPPSWMAPALDRAMHAKREGR